ncbi:hypothetical protein [Poriferisphaera sp. WC338]|uniref:hypothetical protein n=1 Tax=Poriferisphaera sp. WC338 TaxID=3425129 RepID=UPI003D81BBD7
MISPSCQNQHNQIIKSLGMIALLLLCVIGQIHAQTTEANDPFNTSNQIQTSPNLGMNLAPVSYWSTSVPFNNVLLAAKWEDMKNGTTKGSVFVSTGGRYPAGTYICTYKGTGTIRFAKDARAIEYGKNFIKVSVTPRNYLEIQLRSNPADPIHDLKLLLPGTADLETPFNPLYTQRLRPFKTIRFMNWQRTNNNKEVTWADRPTIDTQISETPGMSLEYMMLLTNQLKVDPWFCMPHLADDNYIRQFAEQVKRDLHPDGKVYIEYSNEIWNGVFSQHRYIMAEAKRLSQEAGKKVDWLDVWADQMRRTFTIWEDVFKDQPNRLVRVISGQEVNAWISNQLAHRIGKGNFDALATTAYFGNRPERGKVLQIPNFQARPIALQLIQGALNQLHEKRAPARIKQGEVARKYDVPYITYEAGQHIVPGSDTARQAVDLAQELPEMYGAYIQNMTAFQKAGGSLYTAFDYVEPSTNFGSWGHLQYQNQPLKDAPKYRAILDFYNVQYPDLPNVAPQ